MKRLKQIAMIMLVAVVTVGTAVTVPSLQYVDAETGFDLSILSGGGNPPHTTHNFNSYTVDGKKIKAKCNTNGCEYKTNQLVIELKAENKEYTGKAYVGATVDNLEKWKQEGAAEVTLKYEGREGTQYTKSEKAPTKVGKYKVTMSASNKSVTANFEITKKQLTVSGTVAESKTYDGTKVATVKDKNVGTLSGVCDKDDVKLVVSEATFASKDAGDGIDVKVKYALKGDDKDSYKAPVDATVKANINKKQLVVVGEDVHGKKYDGTTVAQVKSKGMIGGVEGNDEVKFDVVSAAFDSADAAKNVDATITYSISGKDAKNYIAPVGEAQADIIKRTVLLKSASDEKKYDGVALTNDVISVLGDGFVDGEGATYDVTGSQLGKGMSDNEFTYALKDNTKEGNYDVSTAYGKLAVKKSDVALVIKAKSASKVYDGSALKEAGFEVIGDLFESDYVEADIIGSMVKVGVSTNQVVTYKVMNGDVDVTDCYDITTVNGMLTVKADTKAKVQTGHNALVSIYKKHKDEGDVVTVELRTDGPVDSQDKAKIVGMIGKKKAQFVDATLVLIVDGDEQNIGDDNDVLVDVTYKFDFNNKKDLQVLRVHEGIVGELTTEANEDGEYVEFDKENGTITVVAKKYSTYAFAYTEVTVDTADNSELGLFGILAVLALAGAGLTMKRREN